MNSKMHKIKFFISIVITFIVLYSCNDMFSELERLSGEYTYRDTGKELLANKSISLMTNGQLDSTILYLRKNVYSDVVEYEYNDNFIIAIQIPNRRRHKFSLEFELEDVFSSPEKSSQIADSLLAKSPYYKNIFSNDTNYWIVSHIKDSVFGPYNRSKFYEMREKLGVPKELKLN